MSADSTLVVLAVGTVIAVLVASWRRDLDAAQLGTMSARWIAEHRAAEAHGAGR